MIFYFTGTGNSLAAAKQLALEGESLIDMAKARCSGQFTYTRQKNERVGFVFPVYCETLPTIVYDFVQSLKLRGKGYTFAVVTCGGSRSSCAGLLAEELKKRGIPLHYAETVPMPNNAITVMRTCTPEHEKSQLEKGARMLKEIRKALAEKRIRPVRGGMTARFLLPLYRKCAVTRLFFAEDSCTGCGLCAMNCPEQAIRMNDGRPVWVKSHCSHCSGCINKCPAKAIQFGKKTAGRRRYVHPDLFQK
ncbi:MAG: EFR1 family ferrodoxin [Oscillospiraceae bacterium]|nr:EFR1 family ferrodoxin [Oscillospiraceae bacterium]